MATSPWEVVAPTGAHRGSTSGTGPARGAIPKKRYCGSRQQCRDHLGGTDP